MSHKIRFSNTENDWSNGLPLGDGIFGAMAIYSEGVLLYPMNHYEVYYHTSAAPLPAQKAASLVPPTDPGAKRRDARARAIANRAPAGERSFWYYRGKRGAYDGGGGGIVTAGRDIRLNRQDADAVEPFQLLLGVQ